MTRSSTSPLEVRPDLRSLEGYVSPQILARHRMNTNESPLPPPADVIEAVADRLRSAELNRYPDRDANELVDALAGAYRHPREGIWVANGSNEAFLHLFLTFGGPERTSVTFEPTYSLHTLIARISGTRTRRSTRAAPGFGIDHGILTEALEGADIALFCNPNNPTARAEDHGTIEAALERCPLVIVDEAYVEFAPDRTSVADLLGSHDNLVVVRTFSKAWSLAGVRLGYVLAAPEIVAAMSKVRLPYTVSTVSQVVGTAMLERRADLRERVRSIAAERDRIAAGIETAGLRVYPSDANFVLFEVSGSPRDAWESLLQRGVLVRDVSSMQGLERCLRVTAGTPEDTDAFLTALEEVA